jgi:hypothetical protein
VPDPALGDRGDGVVPQDPDVKIAEIAGKQEGDDQAGAVCEHPVPACPAINDEVNLLRTIPFPDDLLFGPELPDVVVKGGESHLLVFTKDART